jgi:hypothetical protein
MSEKTPHTPDPIYVMEKIGDTEYKLEVQYLDVFDNVTLWNDNPRLVPFATANDLHNEEEIEANLRATPGYDGLKRSIDDVGQMDAVYVWKNSDMKKYRVLEGATRVTILRELSRVKPDKSILRKVKAKILPPEFPEEHIAVLLARIHVRGSGVRSWGRYVEAKFIFENTESRNGQRPLTTVADLSRWLGKSPSWISRLRDAYKFAQQYVDHVDGDDAKRHAYDKFSTLEEISKCANFGTRVKADDETGAALRAEVFDMVTHDVFAEYRDARFMKEFHDDPEKWELLKGHEKGVAHRLATELKVGQTSARARIHGLQPQIERALKANSDSLGLEDLEELEKCVDLLGSHVARDVGAFRLRLQSFIQAINETSLSDLSGVTPEEIATLDAGIADMKFRLSKRVAASSN